MLFQPDRVAAIAGKSEQIALIRITWIQITEPILLPVVLSSASRVRRVCAIRIIVQSREVAQGIPLRIIVFRVRRAAVDFTAQCGRREYKNANCYKAAAEVFFHFYLPVIADRIRS